MRRAPVVAAALLTLVVAAGPPQASAAQSVVAGTWTSVDTDGSNQTLWVNGSDQGALSVHLYDDYASVCGVPAQFAGTGRLVDGYLDVRGTITCLPGGNFVRGQLGISLWYDAEADVLVDFSGVVWTRA